MLYLMKIKFYKEIRTGLLKKTELRSLLFNTLIRKVLTKVIYCIIVTITQLVFEAYLNAQYLKFS